ncbi:MAG TPA: choice-of-anchor D domain-containing protein [Acidobacteriaceae bacterium]|nr:choice-of-anchor D domain-containing protein [Acidobacteriaceae bacterium]
MHVYESGFAPVFGAGDLNFSAFFRQGLQRFSGVPRRLLKRVPGHRLWIGFLAGIALGASAFGQGSGARLALSATSVAFGTQAMNSSVTQAVTLKSTGTSALTISAGALSGVAAFKISGVVFPLTLSPGQNAMLNVTFNPTQTGSKSGTISLATNTSSGTATISLGGTSVIAASLQLSPGSVVFGNQSVGSSVTRGLTLIASGSSPLTITAASLTGAIAYSMAGVSFPLTLKPGQSAELELTFHPTQTGAKNAIAKFTTNALAGSTAIDLSGNAIDGPGLTISPANLSFGRQAVGSSVTQAVTLTSSGTSALTISAETQSGVPAFEWAAASLPMTLKPGQATTIEVTFHPTATGTKTANLSFVTNTPSRTAVLGLSGDSINGPGLTISASSVAFGEQPVNSSISQVVTLTSSGTSAVTISKLFLTGAPAYSTSGVSFPVTLSPGQRATLAVQFYPTQTGTKTATAALTTNTAAGTATFGVSGTAIIAPALTLGSTSVGFGGVTLGKPATQTVTLKSSGSKPLKISGAAATGTGFSIASPSFPLTLNPGQSATLDVQFDPTATGYVTGAVSVASNSLSSNPSTIGVSGTGESISNEVDLSWAPPKASGDAIEGFAIYRAINMSSTYELIGSTTSGQRSYSDTTVLPHTTYSYYVVAEDAAGNQSAPSNFYSAAIL